MATVFDVAHYILERLGSMSAMKLQKFVYYAQAWSLVWDERPLFEEDIEAWPNGPVVPDLYRIHSEKFLVSPNDVKGDSCRLDNVARETIDAVLDFYGAHTAQWLSDLTHQEWPWLHARQGIPHGTRSHTIITPASMHEYYSGLFDNE
ncbi:MAG: hypothetical protein C7B46_18995 [Sulfobacillus benefaciens]|uniref:Antitoxin SocA-like Panacea domain-containing protein n=1 Tax=Sulfobacillus benefaciens TaxID=453960 RepID=A0A2T2X2E9_9FIRM|nr:MAG: hypothetical protein C7B46_18995 [Sulfobacillus benefaciens]